MNNDFQGLKNLSFDEMMNLIQSSRAEKKPVKSKAGGYLLLGIGILVCLAITAGIVYFFAVNELSGGSQIMRFIGIFIYIIPVYAFIRPGLKLIKKAGEPMLGKDNYVLYLRSFRADEEVDHQKYGLVRSPESVLKDAFSIFGPLVGLGTRGNEASHGGYRIFVNNHNWRQVVFSMVSHAAITTLYFSNREQILWELSLCRKYADPKRFVIYIDEELEDNIDLLNSYGIFSGHINTPVEKQCFIAFDENWTPFDPLLDRLKGKPFSIGIRRFALRRKYRLDEGRYGNDIAFKWIRRAFSWQFTAIFTAMLLPVMSFNNGLLDSEWLWMPVILVSVTYPVVYYLWMLKSLKLLEYKSFTQSFEEEKSKLKKEMTFLITGWVIQLLPLCFLIALLLEILVYEAGLDSLAGATNYLFSFIEACAGWWFWVALLFCVVSNVFFLNGIWRKEKSIDQVKAFFITR